MRRSIKWACTLLIFIAVFLFGNQLPDEPLKSKAMVVGVGIDWQEDKLSLHLQILTGKSSSDETGSNSRVVSARGSSIGECSYKISREIGLSVTFTHCNVVIIGESLLKSPHLYAVLNYLVTNAYLSDNACMFACEGSSYDLLSCKVGFGINASLYMREIVGQYDAFGDIASKTLREYVVDYHRLGQANWLPFITKKKIAPQIPSSSETNFSSREENYLFDLTGLSVMVKNQYITCFSEKESLIVNCLSQKISKGQLTGQGDHGEIIDWYIISNRVKKEYDAENASVALNVELKAVLKEIIDYEEGNYIDRNTVTDSELMRAEETFAREIQTFYQTLQSLQVDLFGFQEAFYSRNPKNVPAFEDIILNVSVTIKMT